MRPPGGRALSLAVGNEAMRGRSLLVIALAGVSLPAPCHAGDELDFDLLGDAPPPPVVDTAAVEDADELHTAIAAGIDRVLEEAQTRPATRTVIRADSAVDVVPRRAGAGESN